MVVFMVQSFGSRIICTNSNFPSSSVQKQRLTLWVLPTRSFESTPSIPVHVGLRCIYNQYREKKKVCRWFFACLWYTDYIILNYNTFIELYGVGVCVNVKWHGQSTSKMIYKFFFLFLSNIQSQHSINIKVNIQSTKNDISSLSVFLLILLSFCI